MKAKTAIVVAVVVVAAVCGAYFMFFAGGGNVAEGDAGGRSARDRMISEARPSKASVAKSSAAAVADAKKERKRRVKISGGAEWTLDDFDDDAHPYTKEDKEVALELQVALDALDEFDEKDVVAAERSKARGERVVKTEALRAKERFSAAAARAASSSNPAVRKEAVAAYAWRGGESLPELTPMMADADGEVAEEAIDAVQDALEEQENPNLRFEAAAAYVSTFSVNEDALDMLSGTMVSSALEIIEPDSDSGVTEQAALDNRNMVVDTLAAIIENGQGKSVDTAKEAFSDITSEDWISREEANKWAQDPDNYEAPESPEM